MPESLETQAAADAKDVVFPLSPPFLFLFSLRKKQISPNMHFRRIFSLLAPSNAGDTTRFVPEEPSEPACPAPLSTPFKRLPDNF